MSTNKATSTCARSLICMKTYAANAASARKQSLRAEGPAKESRASLGSDLRAEGPAKESRVNLGSGYHVRKRFWEDSQK